MRTLVRVLCAWCGKRIGEKWMDLPPELRGESTHGICPKCAEKVKEKHDATKPLDS